MLDREYFPTGRNSEFCWARAHETCDGETPKNSPALEVLHACVIDLAAYGDRPAPREAYDNLDKCMNRAGWFRYEWYEITIN